MIGIVNYGMGNLGSIQNMLKRIGAPSRIIETSDDLAEIDKIILPGVGSFDHGMVNLTQKGWIEPLNIAALQMKIPILGICLGMQLMTKGSSEGKLPGLGWINAHAQKFSFPVDSIYKIPHMGWNTVNYKAESKLFNGLEEQPRFYFVHSYHVVCDDSDDIAAETTYGTEIICSFQHNNIMGVQFHPEKSHKFGMKLLQNFVNL